MEKEVGLGEENYEVHLIDNSALLRVYTQGKTQEWMDVLTSKMLRHKGVI